MAGVHKSSWSVPVQIECRTAAQPATPMEIGLELTDPQQNEARRRGTLDFGGNERSGLNLSVSNVRSAGTLIRVGWPQTLGGI
jgi:hypothetical protein